MSEQVIAMDALSIRLERIIFEVIRSIKIKEGAFVEQALGDFADALERCDSFGQRFAVAVKFNLVYSGG